MVRGKFFPCKVCAGHFLKMIDKKIFNYKKREDVMKYICEMHNTVNIRLKKDPFDCSRIVDIWGQKSCGCTKRVSESK